MSSKIVHMCVDVRGVLGWSNKDLCILYGQKPTRENAIAVREFLNDKLSDGWEVLPLNPEKPCNGFDKVTGCPGHSNAKEAIHD